MTVLKCIQVSTLDTDSLVATLVRILSVIPIVAAFAGTKLSGLGNTNWLMENSPPNLSQVN
jgi:hypothetical protein